MAGIESLVDVGGFVRAYGFDDDAADDLPIAVLVVPVTDFGGGLVYAAVPLGVDFGLMLVFVDC